LPKNVNGNRKYYVYKKLKILHFKNLKYWKFWIWKIKNFVFKKLKILDFRNFVFINIFESLYLKYLKLKKILKKFKKLKSLQYWKFLIHKN